MGSWYQRRVHGEVNSQPFIEHNIYHLKMDLWKFALLVTCGLIALENLPFSAAYSCPEVDVDFLGNDIDYLLPITNWQECGRICELSHSCQFWTLYQSRCYLRSSDSGLRQLSGRISGAKG